MKISGRNLKRRLYGLSRMRDRMKRMRYFHGHGVHSPFVYELVRKVFMRRFLLVGDSKLFDTLLGMGIPRRRAVELQNLAIHCRYDSWAVDRPHAEAQLLIATAAVEPDQLAGYAAQAVAQQATLAILFPARNRDCDRICHELVAAHSGTSVDNRGYLLIFNNELPKQHFRL